MTRITRIDKIVQMADRLNLSHQIQGDMPGYVITLFTKSGSKQFCGNSAESLAYLEGYASALYVTDSTSFHYDAGNLPDWYTK